MSKIEKYTIAMDFGTNNSYLSESPERELRAKPIIFDNNLKGFETAILYTENRSPIVGTKAVEIYGSMIPEERKRSKIYMHFKPEIGESQKARDLAVDYLKGILELNRIYYRDLLKRGHTFIFGVPSKAPQEYWKALEEIAKEAGFPNLETIEEPKGALFYHLSEKNISAFDARKGVLVVDFGGGTCDFALMEDLKITKSWGSMNLGGRLFDDLFYQIFLAQDPRHEKNVQKENGEFYVHWYLCRELKEKFSQYMKIDRGGTFQYFFPGYGQIKNLTWNRFLEWAKYYRPSKEMREYFLNNKTLESKKILNGNVDLINWFREELEEGLTKDSNRRLGQIILTGGSSLWPFVEDIILELLPVEKENIYLGDNPYAVISMGLSLYPALVHRYEEARNKIERIFPEFLQEEILGDLLDSMVTRLKKDLTQDLSFLLFENKIRPLLKNYKNTGGRLIDLEENMQETTQDLYLETQTIVKEMVHREIEELPYQIIQKIMELFAKEGLYYHCEEEMDLGTPNIQIEGPSFDTKELASIIRTILIPVIIVITAELCGGAGIALIASGPIGWITGGILGAIGAYVGGKKAESYLKSLHLSSIITRIIIREKSINSLLNKAQKDFEEKMEAYLEKEMKKVANRIVQELSPAIQRELESFSLIASLKK